MKYLCRTLLFLLSATGSGFPTEADRRPIRPRASFILACLIASSGSHIANAQCYQFSSGGDAGLAVNITNLPAPVVGSDAYGDTTYSYDLTGLSGNSATLTIGETTATATDFSAPGSGQVVKGGFLINIVSGPVATSLFIAIGSGGLSVAVQLAAVNANLLPEGLPASLPAISAWSSSAVISASIVELSPEPTLSIPSFEGSLDAIGSVCACTPGSSGEVVTTVFAPQEQPNWCWAAVTEMMAINAAGVQTPLSTQCFIANQVLHPGGDTADPHSALCCLDESVCNVPEDPIAGLHAIGYDVTHTGKPAFDFPIIGIRGLSGLSPEDIMTEISCHNRIVGFSIGIAGTSRSAGHAMVIYGYQMISGELNLWVFDPLKTARKVNGQGVYQFQVSYSDLQGGVVSGYSFVTYYYNVRPLAGGSGHLR